MMAGVAINIQGKPYSAPLVTRRGCPVFYDSQGVNRSVVFKHKSLPGRSVAATSSSLGATPNQPEREYKPFPRIKEGNPYRLLGIPQDSSFEEVQEARNYLQDLYRWHEPSRESIELAFETVLKEKFACRQKRGFQPPRTGRRTDVVGAPPKPTLKQRLMVYFDPMVTPTTLINEGVVYGALSLWAFHSTDQSFPLAGAFAYSVYKYQSRRMKDKPEGPHFGGSPVVGAVLTTAINIAVACAAMAVVTAPLAGIMQASMRRVGTSLVILAAGILSVYVK